MENKLKTFLKSHLWLVIIIGLIVVAAFVFWIGGKVEEGRFNRTIDNRQIESNKAVQEARNAQNSAVNVSVERQTTDALREQVITPELNRRRRNSENSKAALDAARKKYHNAEINTSNFNKSVTENCAELKALFPEIKFEYCQP